MVSRASVIESLSLPSNVLFLCSFGILCAAVLVHRVRRWHRLRHIPGPFVCGFTSLRLARQCISGTMHEDLRKLTDIYGPLVRIGPNEILCTDPQALVKICGVRSAYKKGQWYRIAKMDPNYENLPALIDREARKERKAKLGPGYAGRDNDGFEAGVDRALAAFIGLIERKYVSTKSQFRPMDLARGIQFFTMDMTGEVGCSQPLGFLANDTDMHHIIATSEATIPAIAAIGAYPRLAGLMHKRPLSYLLPREGDKIGFGACASVYAEIIEKRLQPGSELKRDILQSFIAHGLSRDELVLEVIFLFLAGSDTTSGLIKMAMLCLLTNLPALERLRSEVDMHSFQAVAGSFVTDAVARNLPYLQAVILETLRFYPPVSTALFPKVVGKGGDTLAGYFVPAGTSVASVAASYPMGRSTTQWGPDADAFRPERWLEADDEELQQMTRIVDLAFGCGQFVCLGKTLAMMVVGKVIFELIKRYDLAVVDPIRPAKVRSVMTWFLDDFQVRITKRSQSLVETEKN